MYTSIDGKMKSESFKVKILMCIRAWTDWTIYPNDFLVNLQNTFLGLSKNSNRLSSQDNNNVSKNDDKEEEAGDDDEDVDGKPIDEDGNEEEEDNDNDDDNIGVFANRDLIQARLANRQNDDDNDQDDSSSIDGKPSTSILYSRFHFI